MIIYVCISTYMSWLPWPTEFKLIYSFCLSKVKGPICSAIIQTNEGNILRNDFPFHTHPLFLWCGAKYRNKHAVSTMVVISLHVHQLYWETSVALKGIFIFKTDFSEIFCVHISTLIRGCHKHPVFSKSSMTKQSNVPSFSAFSMHLKKIPVGLSNGITFVS